MDSLQRKCLSVASLVLAALSNGCKKTPQISLACEATPPALYQGEPVTIHAQADSVSTNKNVHVRYSWSGTGVAGNGETARVASGSLVPGTYTVSAEVREGRPGKEGRKPGQSATCSTEFTVKEFRPPTISCSADPPMVSPGGSSRIVCVGASPQDRPLRFRYSTSVGTVIGIGSVGIFLASPDALIGSVAITGSVEDDENHSASTETTVTIEAAAPQAAIPHVEPLCRISFDLDKKHPTQVPDEAETCLDHVALMLQANLDAKTVVVADSTTSEKETTFKQEQFRAKHVQYFAEQRAVNLKDYLVRDKGIDPARIAIAAGMEDDQKGQAYLVPEGVSFDVEVQGTTWINESAFIPERSALDLKRPQSGSQ